MNTSWSWDTGRLLSLSATRPRAQVLLKRGQTLERFTSGLLGLYEINGCFWSERLTGGLTHKCSDDIIASCWSTASHLTSKEAMSWVDSLKSQGQQKSDLQLTCGLSLRFLEKMLWPQWEREKQNLQAVLSTKVYQLRPTQRLISRQT